MSINSMSVSEFFQRSSLQEEAFPLQDVESAQRVGSVSVGSWTCDAPKNDDLDQIKEKTEKVYSANVEAVVATTKKEDFIDSVDRVNKIIIPQGASLQVEPSAMLAYQDVEVETGMQGTIWSVVKRFLFVGETVFLNTYSAKEKDGWILLKGRVGQIDSYLLQPGESFTMGKGAYVASKDVNISTKFKEIRKGIMGVAELVAQAGEKAGKVYFSSIEGMNTISKEKDGSMIVVDNTIVAYTSGIELYTTVAKSGGVFSGEGLVYEVRGEGVIYVGSGGNSVRDNFLEQVLKTIVPSTSTIVSSVALATLTYLASKSPLLGELKKTIESNWSVFSQYLKLS